MILVPNRQLPLNGNKLLNTMSFLLILCLFFNCGVTKNTTSTTPELDYGNGEYDPVTRNNKDDETTYTPTTVKDTEKNPVDKEEKEVVKTEPAQEKDKSEPLDGIKIETEAASKASKEDTEIEWKDIDRTKESEKDTAIVDKIKEEIEETEVAKQPSEINPEDLLGGMLSEMPIKKDVYRIAILLPFFTNKFMYPHGAIGKDSKMALEFYEGAKLAFDKLRAEGVNLSVSVFDTKGEKSTVEYLLQRSEVLNADVIIGPVTRENSRMVAEFCALNNKTIISPLNRRSDIVQQNSFYLQVNPSMETHYVNLLGHIYKRYGNGNTLIIAPEGRTGTKRVQYINSANLVAEQSASSPLQSVTIDPRSAGNIEFDISGYLVSGGNNIVIVPSSSQSFVNFVMRELSKIRDRYPMIVLGMHQWEHFDKVDYNYYENLKVHISSDFHLNKADVEYRAFKNNYYGIYGINPSENAVKGYDILLYFSRMIHKYGVYPQHHIAEESAQYFHTKFAFRSKYGGASAPDQSGAVGAYENKFVNILKFEDYQFRRVN